VAAAANGDRQPGAPRELDRAGHVDRVERADDQRGTAVDRAVEDRPRQVVLGMRGVDDLAADRRGEVELSVGEDGDRPTLSRAASSVHYSARLAAHAP
jgi:hypothetical protein